MNQTIGKKNKHKRTQTANKGNKGAKKKTKGNKKKLFNEECKRNGQSKQRLYMELIEARKRLTNKIEQKNTEKARKIANQLIKEGGIKSQKFWKIRKANLK